MVYPQLYNTYKLNSKMRRLLISLARLLKDEKQYLLCGVYSGGSIIGQFLQRIVKKKLYHVRLDKADSYKVIETTLPKRVTSTIICLDDAIWTGRTVFAVEKFLLKKYPSVKIEWATLLDCTHYAKYSVF
jgi:pyrimidine operon attenuation protein/uracil phosphoribosyltransferase